ncbi:alkanesulfonate monooxygenase SsuD/methylene tetrahydromethanopterin reductase-like flavin-dependent oxidoreductase (luciferase family) [Paraburkholderia unamae]|uniref:LLM class flavin-dependent oxidoreductase n=1 Tax=Paraburkholderia unamae TaxID=219649 RepID=UPI000DC20902|nr:LLM class flavin-dependent oxidoreductase [Paraburkholderia unamae]RAR62599.1 alkanesulfonate monooxygenase SsuD/methylene tetrahydromethanopterin reductase-like flavin-dependent oxidoreductase (luciferase family) [Paraburkholderia unamae]
MSVQAPRHVILNVNVLDFGVSAAAFEYSGLPARSVTSADYYAGIGRIAERGKLDAFFLADSPALPHDPRGRGARALEPSLILAAVADATRHLGVIGTLSTTYNDPVELAERMLTLDHLSGGRAAWNAVTTYSPAVSPNFGLHDNPERELRYRRANEFVDVVLGLWQGAISGTPLAHRGEFFKVEGLLGLGASPQGHPLLVQAGGSPQGRQLAGRTANAVFAAELDLDAAIEHYGQVKADAVAAGRRREDVAILPGLITIIGSTKEEAYAREARLSELAGGRHEVAALSGRLGFDLSELGYDERIPAHAYAELADPQQFKASLGFRESIVRVLRKRAYTVRELVAEFGHSTHKRFVGTPEEIADFIETWFRAGAADGFNLMPDVFPGGLDVFVDEVVPLLRARGLFRHEYAEDTLRQRWGVDLAESVPA